MPRGSRTFGIFVSSTFVALLGERYGWRPIPPQIEAGEENE